MDKAELSQFDVSRETMERLEKFEQVILKWNPKINLVSKNSLKDLWRRHIVDSVQVFRSVPNPVDHWVDIGSGGGFPGAIVGILCAAESPDTNVTLIESDQRKCAFLRNVARECSAPIKVITGRIEAVEPQNADVLSARALADLSDLLEFSERHLAEKGLAVFPKGETWKKEVDNSRARWSFDLETVKSQTEPSAVILKIKGVARV
ncbi:16S rRNA (guanine(527)-N(7))-methyltransferase RsmG [Epibacterium sp. SM1969]|uniref:Ribosomal RNA small subunit methyltransferase G n=1 Tax=Tritonibacter aquimaris TaxID=2663379 RepID=A0A844AK18_9RHOB|nr:16S rRNA (guanine(527)-N(7))-methyltransferase RsmG [Tritonibacter aquimaris]MQY41860.1 16S rRNA (guanine(527)-N(7))-methyltransferase RsmG [Tritonibacter aquimaris]